MTARRRCSWCGRLVSKVVRPTADVDHGPVDVVWCADLAECRKARAAARPLLPSRIPRP